ncbi:MAG: right-handed parallel beta-helix repeat-containing protein [Myxococcota bacterium]
MKHTWTLQFALAFPLVLLGCEGSVGVDGASGGLDSGPVFSGQFLRSDFVDTGNDNSLDEDDSRFSFVEMSDDGRTALTNGPHDAHVHSHVVNGFVYRSFAYTGAMRFNSNNGSMGITFLSQYPNEDRYYRLLRTKERPEFHLVNRPGSADVGCSGLSHSLKSKINTWYRYEVITEVRPDDTYFSVNVWEEGAAPDDALKIECVDGSPGRLETGTVGVYADGPGKKYWSDLRLSVDLFSEMIPAEGDVTPLPPPPPDPDTETSPVSLYLVESTSNQIIEGPFVDGDTIAISGDLKFNIEAVVDGVQFDRVDFSFGSGATQTESLEPYSACGDANNRNFKNCRQVHGVESDTTLDVRAVFDGSVVGLATRVELVFGSDSAPTPDPAPSPMPNPSPEPPVGPSGRLVVSSDLGWTANEVVNSKLKTVLGGLGTGDELRLSHRYRLNPETIRVPKGVILSGTKGSGFEFVNVAGSKDAYLVFTDDTRVENLSFTDANNDAGEAEVIANNKEALRFEGQNFQIINSFIHTSAKVPVHFNAVSNVLVKGTHFERGYYQLQIRGPSSDIRIEDSVFSNSWGDGIKTSKDRNRGVERVIVQKTVYEGNKRDGIDTTGGFRDSVVQDCIFRNNRVSAMDIKNIYNNASDLGDGLGNDGILITDSVFYNNKNSIVLTTLDKQGNLVTNANHKVHMPHDIQVQNSVFDKSTRMFLIKDAYDITWTDVQLLGGTDEARIFGPKDYSASFESTRPSVDGKNTNYNLNGSNVTTGPSQGEPEGYPFSTFGPR